MLCTIAVREFSLPRKFPYDVKSVAYCTTTHSMATRQATGFRFYETERDAIEVTDGVFFERKLLDLQCSLNCVSFIQLLLAHL